ncbi:MAG: nucleotide exchange factor GrpE [Chloroflexi bacterium]|nr:nucleotide exchange factor GrpE [Chloroflexota bacterium]
MLDIKRETDCMENTQTSGVDIDQLRRIQADFANYKRRVENSSGERTRMANEELVTTLLPILDNFDLALKNMPGKEGSEDWNKGIALIEKHLRSILEKEGLKKMEAEGCEFDPEKHEAVCTQQGKSDDQGKVNSVIREGYRFHDKVIRPVQVSVIKGTTQEPQPIPSKRIPVRKGGDVRWRRSRTAPVVKGMYF